LRLPPGDGRRVQFIGGLAPYGDEEVAEFHPELAQRFVARGLATYV
jgi:hypothetical protein